MKVKVLNGFHMKSKSVQVGFFSLKCDLLKIQNWTII